MQIRWIVLAFGCSVLVAASQAQLPKLEFEIVNDIPANCQRGQLATQSDLSRGYVKIGESNLDLFSPSIKLRGGVTCTFDVDGWKLGWIQIVVEREVVHRHLGQVSVGRFPKLPLNDSIFGGVDVLRFLNGKKDVLVNRETVATHEDQPKVSRAWKRISSAPSALKMQADAAPEERAIADTREVWDRSEFVAYLVLANEAQRRIHVLDAIRWSTAAGASCDVPSKICQVNSTVRPSIRVVSTTETPLTNAVIYEPTANGTQLTYKNDR
jgi:hypothetical protein